MILSRRVALGDVELDELDESIVIRSVDPGVPHESTGTENRSGGFGSRLTMQHWDSLDVSVKYAIDLPKQEMVRRREVFDMVNAWANGMGWLTTNQMEGRRVWVGKVVTPGGGDMWNWLSEYTITFRAYGVPYWQQETPVSVEVASARQTSRALKVAGSADTVLDVVFANISGMEIASATIGAGDSWFLLENLHLAANETLVIDHTEDGLLRIRIQSASGAWRSAMGCRTEESSDDLTVSPGDVTVNFAAQRAGRLTVSCCGRFA